MSGYHGAFECLHQNKHFVKKNYYDGKLWNDILFHFLEKRKDRIMPKKFLWCFSLLQREHKKGRENSCSLEIAVKVALTRS